MKKEVFKKLQDSNFMEKLMSCSDKFGVKEVFKSEKIEVSDDDIKELGKNIIMAVKKIDSMKEEELEKIYGGSVVGKILNFAHYPVNCAVDVACNHTSDRDLRHWELTAGDVANAAIDISIWVGIVYIGYKGCKILYNTAINKGWISQCD